MRHSLLAAYAELEAYDDALPVLQRIAAKGGRSIIYSNANPDMLETSVTASGLGKALDGCISVDGVGVYKPHPKSYEHIQAQLGTRARDVHFVSSNPWDAAGAAKAGFAAIWVNRLRHPYPFDKEKLHREVKSLAELEADGGVQ